MKLTVIIVSLIFLLFVTINTFVLQSCQKSQISDTETYADTSFLKSDQGFKIPDKFRIYTKPYIVSTINRENKLVKTIEYFLYIGNEDSWVEDTYTSKSSSTTAKILAVHPVPGVVKESATFKVAKRWYIQIQFLDTVFNGALLNKDIWMTMPVILKETLIRLGVDDDDLLTIAYNIYTGSISVFYHPRYSNDERYYNEKVEKLKKTFSKVSK